MSRPAVRAALAELKAYEPETGDAEILLDANESPFGPPEEFRRRAGELLAGVALNRYPDPRALALREAAGNRYGVEASRVMAGNGSDELIQLLLSAFGGSGARLMVPSPAFSMYALCAKALDWEVVEAPLSLGFGLDTDFVARARQLKPRMIMLASPNNPTGNCFDESVIRELLTLDDCLVVVDEAYAEFSGRSLAAQTVHRDNLVVLRTLSKAYGMAALRLGFALLPGGLREELEKVRLPYNVNAVSQALGTLALSLDKEFVPLREEILRQRDRLAAALDEAGFEVYPSESNFVLARHEQASKIKAALAAEGIRVRGFSGPRLNHCLRINAGTAEETDRVVSVLQKGMVS